MRKILLMIMLLITVSFAEEKIYVIERETSSVAVLQDCKFLKRIENLHNLNHAVIKFYENEGYLITRDGYIIKFDPIEDKVIKEIKVGESSIGFVVTKDYIAVANYSNKSVVILDKDLNIIQTIITDSRNVGIKNYKDYLAFSLMDKDEIWILKKQGNVFKVEKIFKDVGQVPFDAMMEENLYIVGFFNSPHIGVLNLDTLEYKKIQLFTEYKEPVLKVPHFGMWVIGKDKIVIPAVGDKKLFVFDKNFKPIKTVSTYGLPVFTSISPDEKYLAVTFSGNEFPYVQILNFETFDTEKILKFDGKVLHVRWGLDGKFLYISVNDSNKVFRIKRDSWDEDCSVDVIKPSGIFLFSK
jgi:protein NirF